MPIVSRDASMTQAEAELYGRILRCNKALQQVLQSNNNSVALRNSVDSAVDFLDGVIDGLTLPTHYKIIRALLTLIFNAKVAVGRLPQDEERKRINTKLQQCIASLSPITHACAISLASLPADAASAERNNDMLNAAKNVEDALRRLMTGGASTAVLGDDAADISPNLGLLESADALNRALLALLGGSIDIATAAENQDRVTATVRELARQEQVLPPSVSVRPPLSVLGQRPPTRCQDPVHPAVMGSQERDTEQGEGDSLLSRRGNEIDIRPKWPRRIGFTLPPVMSIVKIITFLIFYFNIKGSVRAFASDGSNIPPDYIKKALGITVDQFVAKVTEYNLNMPRVEFQSAFTNFDNLSPAANHMIAQAVWAALDFGTAALRTCVPNCSADAMAHPRSRWNRAGRFICGMFFPAAFLATLIYYQTSGPDVGDAACYPEVGPNLLINTDCYTALNGTVVNAVGDSCLQDFVGTFCDRVANIVEETPATYEALTVGLSILGAHVLGKCGQFVYRIRQKYKQARNAVSTTTSSGATPMQTYGTASSAASSIFAAVPITTEMLQPGQWLNLDEMAETRPYYEAYVVRAEGKNSEAIEILNQVGFNFHNGYGRDRQNITVGQLYSAMARFRTELVARGEIVPALRPRADAVSAGAGVGSSINPTAIQDSRRRAISMSNVNQNNTAGDWGNAFVAGADPHAFRSDGRQSPPIDGSTTWERDNLDSLSDSSTSSDELVRRARRGVANGGALSNTEDHNAVIARLMRQKRPPPPPIPTAAARPIIDSHPPLRPVGELAQTQRNIIDAPKRDIGDALLQNVDKRFPQGQQFGPQTMDSVNSEWEY